MTGIWQEGGDGWMPLTPVGFPLEKNLHDNIEKSPAMLPLPGQPRLVVLGREVPCGNGRADLIAIDATSGQPVVIEIKLERNTDRRAVVAQVLSYAAFLHRLSVEDFEALLAPYLPGPGPASVVEAVGSDLQDGSVNVEALRAGLGQALEEGRFRCIVVIDRAPADLVELVGYLQVVTNDRLSVDLVTVTAYQVGERQILVPQLVEPDRRPTLPKAASAAKVSGSYVTKGGEVFEKSIALSAPEYQAPLRRLYQWARQLEVDGLAVLYSSTGTGRWVLNPRLPAQDRALLSIWNEKGPFVSPHRTVFEAVAPISLGALDQAAPDEIRRGNYIRSDLTDVLLSQLRDAYLEANGRLDNGPAILATHREPSGVPVGLPVTQLTQP